MGKWELDDILETIGTYGEEILTNMAEGFVGGKDDMERIVHLVDDIKNGNL